MWKGMFGQKKMKTNEREKKRMLDKQEYDDLRAGIGGDRASELQINYYYDTETEYFKNHNITCRIRQKNQRLVGTVKRHGADGQEEHSVEQSFFVKKLPQSLEVDGQRAYLKGCLITERIEVVLSANAVLFLDKNSYLGETDYELEIEYEKGHEGTAEGVMLLLDKLMLPKPTLSRVMSKSDRFFCVLSGLSDQVTTKPKNSGTDPDAYMLREVATNKGESHGRI